MSEVRTGYSYIEYEGDGVTDTYPVNFVLGYLRPAFVTCQVNNEEDGLGNPVYRSLTFLPGDTGMVQIAGPVPGVGEPIVFRRVIPKDLLMHLYANGSILDYPSLDESHLQLMMALQEVLDGFGLANIYTDVDMHGFKIVGVLSDSAIPDSVVTFEELQKFSADVQALAVLGTSEGASFVGYGSTTVEEHLDALAASGGSSLVGFLQDGVGAVARTVQAKLRDVVSVFDYMTQEQIDDVVAGTALLDVAGPINKAAEYVFEKGGGGVYYPAGVYLVGRYETTTDSGTQHLAIRIHSGVYHFGDGVEATKIFVKNNANCHCFYQYEGEYCGVANMTIDCNRDNQDIQNPSTGNDPAGIIIINKAYNVHLRDLHIKNTPDYGIGFEGPMDAKRCLIENCIIENTGADSIDTKNGSNSSAHNIIRNVTVLNINPSVGQGIQQAAINPRRGWGVFDCRISGLPDGTVGIRYNDGDGTDPSGGLGGDYNICSNIHIETTPDAVTLGTFGIQADGAGCSYSNIFIKNVHTGIIVRAREQNFSNIYILDPTNDGIAIVDQGFLTTGERCNFSNVTVRGANDAGFSVKTGYNRFVNCTARSCRRGWFIESGRLNCIIGGEASDNGLGAAYSIQDAGEDTTYFNVFNGTTVISKKVIGAAMLGVTGMTTTPELQIRYVIEGDIVTIHFPEIIATSNDAGFTFTGFPSALRLSTGANCWFFARMRNNNVGIQGMFVISSTSVVTCYPQASGGGWSATGEKGLYSTSISYLRI